METEPTSLLNAHGETCFYIQNIYIFVFPDIIIGNKYGAIKIA